MRLFIPLRPIIRTSSVLLATGIIALVATAQSAHAAPLTTSLTQPISGATNLLQQVVSPVTDALSPTPTTSTPIVSNPSTTTSVPASTADTSTEQATDDTTSSPTTNADAMTMTGSPANLAVANQTASATNMGVMGSDGVMYGSMQISAKTANDLYRAAGLAAILGFILYASTVLPNNPINPKRLLIRSRDAAKKSLKVKTNQS